ncbi:MAG: 4'-phosphopantetheinyl transferase superfamily protein [Anaerolineaceae bacterium]
MIHWTFAQNHFPNVQALLNETITCFSDEEREEFRKFAVPKRGMEWLFSRWMVKKLAAEAIGETDLRLLRIRKETGGVPYVEFAGRRAGWLSLSHSHLGVLAAFSLEDDCRFGADLEHLEPRSPGLLNDFFTPAEGAWVASLPEHEQTLAANLVWSAKEAYLKAIGIGLQIDTRNVDIQNCQLDENNGWQSLGFCVNSVADPSWRLFYRCKEDYILTLCLPPDTAYHFQEVRGAAILKEPMV